MGIITGEFWRYNMEYSVYGWPSNTSRSEDLYVLEIGWRIPFLDLK